MLEFVPEKFRADRDIVLEAVKNTGLAIRYASRSLRNDRDIAFFVIKGNPFGINVFDYINDSLKNDRELMLLAVALDGLILEQLNDNLKRDQELFLEAFLNNVESLKFADESLRKNKSFILKCIEVAEVILPEIHESLINDIDIKNAIERKKM
jgi:hypothetical protein